MFNDSLQAVKDAIVKKHNELRSKVAKGKETRGVDGSQPKASNMRKLVWNDELAEVAQRYQVKLSPSYLGAFIVIQFEMFNS